MGGCGGEGAAEKGGEDKGSASTARNDRGVGPVQVCWPPYVLFGVNMRCLVSRFAMSPMRCAVSALPCVPFALFGTHMPHVPYAIRYSSGTMIRPVLAVLKWAAPCLVLSEGALWTGGGEVRGERGG